MTPKTPMNIRLLKLTQGQLNLLGEVNTTEVFTPSSENFHPSGLYSTEIFGPIGSKERNTTPGYISLNTKIIHPRVYANLLKLDSIYIKVLKSQSFGRIDEETGNMVAANIDTGDTGFEYFLSVLPTIKFKRNKSRIREKMIVVIEKAIEDGKLLIETIEVMEAGLREYIVDSEGNVQEEKVNDMYRTILGNASLLKGSHLRHGSIDLINPIRVRLQNNVHLLYKYIISLFDGKTMFTQGKWTKRSLTYSTRNVLTAIPERIKSLNDFGTGFGFNDVALGLFQYCNAVLPMVKYELREGLINKIASEHSVMTKLIDPVSLKTGLYNLALEDWESLTTDKGLEKTIAHLAGQKNEDQVLMIKDKYVALIWDDGKEVKLITDTDDIPEDRDKRFLRPPTYGELFFLLVYQSSKQNFSMITRFPVTGEGSIYPARVYLKTTIQGEKRVFLDEDWNETITTTEYPKKGATYFKSMSPHYSKLLALDADFDGDTGSSNSPLVADSKDELREFMNSKKFYVNIAGKITHSAGDNLLKNVEKTLKRKKK